MDFLIDSIAKQNSSFDLLQSEFDHVRDEMAAINERLNTLAESGKANMKKPTGRRRAPNEVSVGLSSISVTSSGVLRDFGCAHK